MPLKIIRQDITKMKCDAIVNSTNSQMIGYSGVDEMIHELAGPELDNDCANSLPLGLGDVRITKGYNLGCKYIIHTKGPHWLGGYCNEKAILKSCYIRSLNLAKENSCKSIAFPLISSGAYGYPKDKVLKVAVEAINEFLQKPENEMQVSLCVYDKESYEFSKKLYGDVQDYINKSLEQEYIKDSRYWKQEWTKKGNLFFTKPLTLNEYIKKSEKSFVLTLYDLIQDKKLTNVQCYKRANISKTLFSKLFSKTNYQPSKNTAVALAIALKLDIDETQEFLAKAGYTLSKCLKSDLIVRYFIENKKYDIMSINETLFEFGQKLLGSN